MPLLNSPFSCLCRRASGNGFSRRRPQVAEHCWLPLIVSPIYYGAARSSLAVHLDVAAGEKPTSDIATARLNEEPILCYLWLRVILHIDAVGRLQAIDHRSAKDGRRPSAARIPRLNQGSHSQTFNHRLRHRAFPRI
jgi:hypothetical protein